MKKKISALLVGTMIVATMITGCGKKDEEEKVDVNGEELVQTAFNDLTSGVYYTADGVISAKIKIDMGLLSGGATTGQMLDFVADGKMKMEADKDTSYDEMDFSVSFFGQTQTQSQKTWEQDQEDTGKKDVYEFDSASGTWIHTEVEVDEDEEPSYKPGMLKDITVKKDGDGYKVTGKLDLSNFNDITQGELNSLANSSYMTMLEGVSFDVSMCFNANKKLTSMEMSVSDLEINGVTVSNVTVSINNINFDAKAQLDVPAEISSSAVSNDSSFDGYDVDDLD